MKIAGLALIIGGWLLSVGGLLATSSNQARAVIACLGIAVSLLGSLKVLNGHYLKNAIWKR